ncbi:MAG: ferrous iron transport protein [Thermacetogenium sp.]|nr:ferrous iron transport protein [Thermacetogenium sp.]
MGSLTTPLSSLLAEIDKEISPARRQEIRDSIVGSIYSHAEAIAGRVVHYQERKMRWDEKIDDVLTSRLLGVPVMLALLGCILWLTVIGANYPSQALAAGLFWLEERLTALFLSAGAPAWLHGVLVLGMYRTLAWVVSVMLPPMAIFFMGFGCNAAGVTSCRIIESPRERLIAILTNVFVPCNGRFPTLIALSLVFMGGAAATPFRTAAAAATVVALVLLGVAVTLLMSWVLSRTILKGIPSFFTLELPPYRKPQVGRILVRSLLDRTIFVLMRAVVVAAPAGALTWILANTHIGSLSMISHLTGLLDPFGRLLGMDGVIILAFILGLPANEIVLPIMIVCYVSAGTMLELDSLQALQALLVDNGWTRLTALSVMLFSLLHYPCGTTLLTIHKETNSLKWTVLAALIPLTVAVLTTFLVAQLATVLARL